MDKKHHEGQRTLNLSEPYDPVYRVLLKRSTVELIRRSLQEYVVMSPTISQDDEKQLRYIISQLPGRPNANQT